MSLDIKPIDITEVEAELLELVHTKGISCIERVEPEEISYTTEPTEIPPTSLELFYSDGMATGRIVPAGTRLSNGKTVISDEEFERSYIPYPDYVDENGHIHENLFIRIIPAKVLPNPYGRPVIKTNPAGIVIGSGDENCCIVETVLSDRFGLYIYSVEQVNKLFVPYNPNPMVKKKGGVNNE